MLDLSRTYRHLGRTWNQDELAVRYAAANRHGKQLLTERASCLDEDAREAPAALTDTLARLLAVWVFADAARTRSE